MAVVNTPQSTIQYKTFVKRAMVEALQEAFGNHPDPTVQSVKVGIDYQDRDFKLPGIIIRFHEQSLHNAGVGHFEWGSSQAEPNVLVEFQHRMYTGEIEFEIWASRTVDLDVISDAVVEVLAMDEVSASGEGFLNRLFNERLSQPYGASHFATLNFDEFNSTGERQQQTPWGSEDDLVFQNSYLVAIFGEFYSYVPPTPTTYGPITEVIVYGYPVGADGVTPIDPLDQAPPNEPQTDTMDITGPIPGEQDI